MKCQLTKLENFAGEIRIVTNKRLTRAFPFFLIVHVVIFCRRNQLQHAAEYNGRDDEDFHADTKS